MKSIYKYNVTVEDEVHVNMRAGAQLLCVQLQYDTPKVWALVDDEQPIVRRIFRWRGTGRPAVGLGSYVGTIQDMGGRLVFHLFVDSEEYVARKDQL